MTTEGLKEYNEHTIVARSLISLAEHIEILEKAIKLIERGWTQGHFEAVNDEGITCYCALGAMREVVTSTNRSKDLDFKWNVNGYTQKLFESYGDIKDTVFWNDRKGQTQERVLKRMRLAVKRMREDLES